MEERITQLESLAALQDNVITQLNEEIFRQQQDLARLLRRIEMLEQKLQRMEQPDGIAGDEKPPHW